MRSSRPADRAPASPRRAGYPIIAVPFGMVPNAPQQPFPAGFNAKPAPFGVGFVGAQCSEPKLIEIAYAFEQATKKRVPPRVSRPKRWHACGQREQARRPRPADRASAASGSGAISVSATVS